MYFFSPYKSTTRPLPLPGMISSISSLSLSCSLLSEIVEVWLRTKSNSKLMVLVSRSILSIDRDD